MEQAECAALVRSLLPNFRENGLGNPEACLSKRSDCIIEVDESRLIGFIEHGERAGNPQPSANCLLPAGLLIDEHQFGMHLDRRARSPHFLRGQAAPSSDCPWDSELPASRVLWMPSPARVWAPADAATPL